MKTTDERKMQKKKKRKTNKSRIANKNCKFFSLSNTEKVTVIENKHI